MIQEDFFFFGTLAPALRASLNATATACLRLLTFLPLPDFNVPSLYSFITLWIFLSPFDAGAFLVAMPRRPGIRPFVSGTSETNDESGVRLSIGRRLGPVSTARQLHNFPVSPLVTP